MNQSFYVAALAAATRALHEGDDEKVLRETRALILKFTSRPMPLPFPGGMSAVDALLDAVAQRIAPAPEAMSAAAPEGDWILATCVYDTGGHTPVMRDLAAALPDGLRGMVLTLAGHEPGDLLQAALDRTGLPPASIRRADAPTLLETGRRVVRAFDGNPPRRLFLFQHPEDTAAIAAAAALMAQGTEVWLVHHADSYPSAGLYLPGARILDLTPRACAFTRHVLRLRSTWLPLTCPDPGPPVNEFFRRGHLTTALSGSLAKTSQDSPHSYPEVVAAILRATGGTHVHIGPLDPARHSAVLRTLDDAGLKADRFVHVPVAATLVQALQQERVDLLINTWPAGGARAAVESMAAGVPLVWQAPHESFARLRHQMAYPGAAVWRHPADLAALVATADPNWLATQSRAARLRYETLHHPSRWREFFAGPESVAELPLPEGYDASLFVPALWDCLLEFAIDEREVHLEDLKLRLKRQQGKLGELADLKRRLRKLESEMEESRFPWPIRLWRRWRRR